ncbi:MAG: hypothetical protein LBJ89_01400 [Holosporales bacterium]|jgi:hypothetical protein|nr:hypothetical protein [Holosporales bacterium]
MTAYKFTKIRLAATISVFLLEAATASEDRYLFGGSISGQNKIIMETLIGSRVHPQEIETILEPMLHKHWELRIFFNDAQKWAFKSSIAPQEVTTLLSADQPLRLCFDQLATQMSSLKRLILSDQQKDALISSLQNTLAEYSPEGILYKVVQIKEGADTCLNKVSGVAVQFAKGSEADFESKCIGVFLLQRLHNTAVEFSDNVRDTLGSLLKFVRDNPDPIFRSDIYSAMMHMYKQIDEICVFFSKTTDSSKT